MQIQKGGDCKRKVLSLKWLYVTTMTLEENRVRWWGRGFNFDHFSLKQKL